MCETAKALALCPVAVWENLRDEDPNYRALADRMGSDEGEDACRNDRVVFREKSPCNQTK